jgi:hypothetical protein
MYTVKDVKIAQRPVPWLVYQRGVFEALRRLTSDEQFSIGVGRNDKVSLPSVPVRLVDVLNAFGIFRGWFWVNLVNKRATWASWSPTVDDIWQSETVGAGDVLDEVSVDEARAQRDVFFADERRLACEERDRVRDIMLIQREEQPPPPSIRQARRQTAAAAEAVDSAVEIAAARKRRRADLLRRLTGHNASDAVQRRDDGHPQSRLRRLLLAPSATVPEHPPLTLSAAQRVLLIDVQARLLVSRHRHGWCARHPLGQVLLVRKTVAELHTIVAFAGTDWTSKFANRKTN